MLPPPSANMYIITVLFFKGVFGSSPHAAIRNDSTTQLQFNNLLNAIINLIRVES